MLTSYKSFGMQIELSKFVKNSEESQVFQNELSVFPKMSLKVFC